MSKPRRHIVHRWHKVLKELCYPHIIIVVIFTAISIFGLIYSFSFDAAIPFLQYLTYIISAYTLTIICFRIPNIIKTTKIYVKNTLS